MHLIGIINKQKGQKNEEWLHKREFEENEIKIRRR